MIHEATAAQAGAPWAEALERGQIVRFRRAPIELPPEADQEFLRSGLAPNLRRKNVSYYPAAGRLAGLRAGSQALARARGILQAHGQRVRDFLQQAMPGFTRGWTVGTSSFRPLEEEGRALPAHASSELIHFDAGAYGATHGDRILRFFVNLNPSADRVWASEGNFSTLWKRHGAEAGIAAGPCTAGAAERLYSALLRAVGRAFPMARVLETSPYDRRMRRFHNWMKDTPSFQAAPHEQLRFPPFSAWMVLTDGVSHACLRGQHALVDTFLVPLRNCRLREETPFHLLSGAGAGPA